MHINVHTLTHIYMRGEMRENIYIYIKRHLESMLKGIKSYLCLVQTSHVGVEGLLFGYMYSGMQYVTYLKVGWESFRC
jgi:hypothetical protein